MSPVPTPSRPPFARLALLALLVLFAIGALYFAVVLNWNYSVGERAGWVQKFSKKGWLCKTWEGEIALVSMPGAIPEKFHFTVWDDAVAVEVNRYMGRRVALHYEEKVGLPTRCFGETRHFVTRVTPVEEVPLAPGVVVPAPGLPPAGATPVPPTNPGTAPSPPMPGPPPLPRL